MGNLPKQARTFLGAEQDGSVSIWNLFWFTGVLAILGLAVDISGATNTKAKLQMVADTSSHAGVIDIFPVAADAITAAVTYGENNIPQHENVILGSDVVLGYWDSTARTFDPNTTKPFNAVRTVAERDTSRANALLTSFLRVVGFYNWDINAQSTSALGSIRDCIGGGLLAEGTMEQTSNNTITGGLCLHGETSFKISQNNLITCGVVLSTPSPDNYHNGTPPVPTEGCDENNPGLTNEEMIAQTFMYRSLRVTADVEYANVKKMLDAFVDTGAVNDPLSILPPYLDTVSVVDLNAFNNDAKKGTLIPGTLYSVSCAGINNKNLELTGFVQNIGVYTDCPVNVIKDKDVSALKPEKTVSGQKANCDPDDSKCENVDWMAEIEQGKWSCAETVANGFEPYNTLLDTVSGKYYKDGETSDSIAQVCGIEPGANGLWDNVFVFTSANENDPAATSVTLPNNVQLGRLDGCTEGGGVRMYVGGSIHTPSGTIMNDVQIVALGDAFLAAKANGVMGLSVTVEGDIKYTAQGLVGGCNILEDAGESDAIVSVRPIAIVD